MIMFKVASGFVHFENKHVHAVDICLCHRAPAINSRPGTNESKNKAAAGYISFELYTIGKNYVKVALLSIEKTTK